MTTFGRRALNAVPTTADEARAPFRCEAHRLTLADGSHCAKMHARARQTRDIFREACIECPAGAARAALLNIGEPRCPWVLADGKVCGDRPVAGHVRCARHRSIAQKPGHSVGHVVGEFAPHNPEWAPTGPRRDESVPRPEPRRTDPHPTYTCDACGATRPRVVRAGVDPAPYCSDCRNRARSTLRARGYPRTRAGVDALLRDPHAAPPRIRPRGNELTPCGRCGSDCRSAFCSKCRRNAAKTARKRGIDPTDEMVVRWLSGEPMPPRPPRPARPKPAPKPVPMMKCCVCGDLLTASRMRGRRACGRCRQNARDRLERRGIDPTDDAVTAEVERPSPPLTADVVRCAGCLEDKRASTTQGRCHDPVYVCGVCRALARRRLKSAGMPLSAESITEEAARGRGVSHRSYAMTCPGSPSTVPAADESHA